MIKGDDQNDTKRVDFIALKQSDSSIQTLFQLCKVKLP